MRSDAILGQGSVPDSTERCTAAAALHFAVLRDVRNIISMFTMWSMRCQLGSRCSAMLGGATAQLHGSWTTNSKQHEQGQRSRSKLEAHGTPMYMAGTMMSTLQVCGGYLNSPPFMCMVLAHRTRS